MIIGRKLNKFSRVPCLDKGSLIKIDSLTGEETVLEVEKKLRHLLRLPSFWGTPGIQFAWRGKQYTLLRNSKRILVVPENKEDILLTRDV